MIKFSNKSRGSNVDCSLKSIKSAFYGIVESSKGKITPLCQLKEAQRTNKLRGYKLKKRNIQCINYLVTKYRKVLLGDPVQLEKVIMYFERKKWSLDVFNNGTTEFGKALLGAFGYTSRFRSVPEKGVWLAKKLNVKTCPYCNSNYTLFVPSTNTSKAYARFQFDHFFAKDRYPYLSVSLFNLIPCCASCNLRKGSESQRLKNLFHPYVKSINSVSRFKIDYPIDVFKMGVKNLRGINIDDIKIKFESTREHSKKIVETHDKIYDISGIYGQHKDIAHEMLVNSRLYDKFYQRGIMKTKGLFPDRLTLLRYLLGNYMEEKNILRRPLSKFTQDIAKQVGLIS